MASDSVISAAMQREAATNPVYSGRFEMIAGLEIIVTPSANLPGGVGTSAFIHTDVMGLRRVKLQLMDESS